MTQADFLTGLGEGLLDVVRPLEQALTSPDQLGALLARHGWVPPSDAAAVGQLRGVLDIATLEQDTLAIGDLLAQVARSGAPTPAQIATALNSASALIQRIQARTNQPPPASLGPPAQLVAPLGYPQFWATFPTELVDDLLVRYLELRWPMVFGPLLLLGVVDRQAIPASTNPPRMAHSRDVIHWEALPRMLTDPRAQVVQTYGWGATLDAGKLLENIERALLALGVAAHRRMPLTALAATYYAASNPALVTLRELRVPLLAHFDLNTGFVEFGLIVLPIPAAGGLPTASGSPVGVLVGPYGQGDLHTSFPVGGPLSLNLVGGFNLDAPMGIEIRPGRVGTTLGGAVQYDLGVELQAADPLGSWVLIGRQDSTRLQIGGLTLGLRLRGTPAAPELVARLAADTVEAVVDFAESDGFLSTVFGGGPQTFTLSGALTWSSQTGLSIEGGSGLKLAVPVNRTLGPIHLDTLAAEVRPQAPAAPPASSEAALVVGISGAVVLGPLTVTMGEVGLEFSLRPRSRTLADGSPAPAGMFGYLDVGFGFKPPSSLGLKIDAGAVAGGGYLYFDPQLEQYAGVLSLELTGGIAVKAVGLLTTRLPDGSPGFSLLIMISAEDFTPIPLGLGFTLAGIGGLLGVNRTVAVEVLRSGLKNHALDALLFPRDPVRNARQIVGTAGRVFPPAAGRYLIGPIARIGWGSPTMVTVDLAVILELPASLRLILLAQLRAVLPDVDHPLIRLQIDAVGVIDFDRGELALDGTLFDSSVLAFALTGDMALRARWAGESTFLLAIGGFNPRFAPPPGLPKLQRLALSLSTGSNPRLRMETYLAITSNTVQFGATLDVHADWDSGSGFALDGHLGFDALFHFAPFAFIADFGGTLAVSYAPGSPVLSASLDMVLSGPVPWRAQGKATFLILGYKQSVAFDVVLSGGDPPLPPPPLAVADVRTKLLAAFQDPRNWAAQTPDGDHALVTLRRIPDAAGVVLAHPLGDLAVHQRVVPLGVEVSRFGNSPLEAPHTFDVDPGSVSVNGTPPTAPPTGIQDAFAAAQFRALSDDERLSRPSFEKFRSGIECQFNASAFHGQLTRSVGYDEVVVDQVGHSRTAHASYQLPDAALAAQIPTGAVAQVPLRTSGANRFPGPRRPLAIRDLPYVVAARSDLQAQPIAGVTPAGTSYTEAIDALRTHLRTHRSDAAWLQVVARHEAVGVS